jgi:hypothetical protein
MGGGAGNAEESRPAFIGKGHGRDARATPAAAARVAVRMENTPRHKRRGYGRLSSL